MERYEANGLGILILFGGGLALAKGLEEAGLIQLLGNVLAQIAPDNLFY
ncbi:MAG: anion permease [Sphingobacteriales bacterium]|nr:anion permease [Sphingobacteriales bacterium]